MCVARKPSGNLTPVQTKTFIFSYIVAYPTLFVSFHKTKFKLFSNCQALHIKGNWLVFELGKRYLLRLISEQSNNIIGLFKIGFVLVLFNPIEQSQIIVKELGRSSMS